MSDVNVLIQNNKVQYVLITEKHPKGNVNIIVIIKGCAHQSHARNI